MKQSEKYDLLQYTLWHYVRDVSGSNISELDNKTFYSINVALWRGAELKEMWNKLLRFRDEARQREMK